MDMRPVCPSFGYTILRKLSASGGFTLWPHDQGLCPSTRWGLHPDPVIGSCSVLAMVRAPPLFYPSLRMFRQILSQVLHSGICTICLMSNYWADTARFTVFTYLLISSGWTWKWHHWSLAPPIPAKLPVLLVCGPLVKCRCAHVTSGKMRMLLLTTRARV